MMSSVFRSSIGIETFFFFFFFFDSSSSSSGCSQMMSRSVALSGAAYVMSRSMHSSTEYFGSPSESPRRTRA